MLTFGPPVFAALFAEEELQRTKTDHLDAIGIARFAAQKHPQGRGSLCRTHYYYLPTSEAARALGKKRWEGMTEADRQEFMARARSKIKLTEAERSEIGRKAVNARWARARASKPAGESAGAPKRSAGSSQPQKRKPKKK